MKRRTFIAGLWALLPLRFLGRKKQSPSVSDADKPLHTERPLDSLVLGGRWIDPKDMLIVKCKTGRLFGETRKLESKFPDREWFAPGLGLQDGGACWDRILYGVKREALDRFPYGV